MELNSLQTPIEKLRLDTYPKEVQDQFWEFVSSVPYISRLISEKRPYARDLERDSQNRIIVDITNPHILENMDYFRPTALYFQENKKLCPYRPNSNPNSEFYKWFKEEVRRCREGYVRESDGEWITGHCYFFWNYCPILQSKIKGKKKANRVYDFPEIWEGHYYKFHYIDQAREAGKHGCELASRSKGKSYTMASILAKIFILGESEEVNKEVRGIVTAYQKEYLNKDGVLNKFQSYIDFCALNSEFPSLKLKSSLPDMQWTMGYYDLDSGTRKGTLNEVLGASSKDDIAKIRGKRGVFIGVEESGSFPSIKDLYLNMLPSVEEGDIVFGQLYLQGTAGDKDSDFSGLQEIMYNPDGYHMYKVKNVFDCEGQGGEFFTFFFPGYVNRKGCYDANGNSDVTKALLEILLNRYTVKYNTTSTTSITKVIAETCITPREAILRAAGNLFPVVDLNERISQLDTNTSLLNSIAVGSLVLKGDEVSFIPTNNIPIRDYPLGDNKAKGAIEFYKMPEKNSSGVIPKGRYCIGVDPIDDDCSNTMSLYSSFVFDLFTDQIVCEYTGRQEYADECYEITRRQCMFYNAECLYESDKKGIYAYFVKMRSLFYLAQTPEYLRDKDLVKTIGYGNKAYGVKATRAINNYADRLTKEWLISPTPVIKEVTVKDEYGERIETIETTQYNLYNIMSRALLRELAQYDPNANFDRIRSLGMVMLFRESYMSLFGENKPTAYQEEDDDDDLSNDPLFSKL